MKPFNQQQGKKDNTILIIVTLVDKIVFYLLSTYLFNIFILFKNCVKKRKRTVASF